VVAGGKRAAVPTEVARTVLEVEMGMAVLALEAAIAVWS
jgi:hypothetical protein